MGRGKLITKKIVAFLKVFKGKAQQRRFNSKSKHTTLGDSSFTSHLEGMALRDAKVEGGSGYAEAAVRDLGFPDEKTNGAVGRGEPVAKKKRGCKSKSKAVGGAILGLAEITTDPRGDPDVSAPLEKTAPTSSKENVQAVPVVKSEMNGVVGGSKKEI